MLIITVDAIWLLNQRRWREYDGVDGDEDEKGMEKGSPVWPQS